MENWKAVVGYDGLYEVSDLGRVRSLAKQMPGCRSFAAMILSAPVAKVGYRYVTLWKLGKKNGWHVHRLVALAFLGQPSSRMVCDHINQNKLDNRLVNLRWATQGQNNCNSSKPRERKRKDLPRGVDWVKKDKRYRARIDHTVLGYFLTVQEAEAARIAAEPIYHGEFAPCR